MISGAHAVIFTKEAEGLRAFLRDALELSSRRRGRRLARLRLPPAEPAAHPSEGELSKELYLMCEDLKATTTELSAKGVEFCGPVRDEGFGLITAIRLPGGGELGLYEPRHPTAR